MEAIESFAADTSSRTSVALTQVLLARRYGIRRVCGLIPLGSMKCSMWPTPA